MSDLGRPSAFSAVAAPAQSGTTGSPRTRDADPRPGGSPAHHPARALALTKAEAAELLGISQRKLEQYIGSGELPSIKFGRARRVLTDDLAAFAQHLRDETLWAEHPSAHGRVQEAGGRAVGRGGGR
ncbi:MAG: helix-turn-helix domain-containing protein [Chloroflexi bacterium]|nr:helix-turn-helix domain-containing protein [Chloroflexota bacterium]